MLKRQNDKQFLELLVAMRFYYDKAKRIRRMRVIGNIVIALVSGYLVSILPQYKHVLIYVLPLLGAAWTAVTRLLLIDREKVHTKTAATIQEEFDTRLFGLSWHKSLAGNHVQPEIIKHADRQFKGDRSKLMNWYEGLNAPNPILNVLLAQRTNLTWDTALRKRYAVVVAAMTALYFGVTVAVGAGLKIDVGMYILTLLIPSMSILLHGTETSREHWRRAVSCEKSGREVLATYITNSQNLSPDILQTCREYQDFIFQKRCDINLVPNKMYWLSRDQDDDMMKAVNEGLSNSQTI